MNELFPEAERVPRQVSLVRLAGDIARSLAGVGPISVEGEVHRPTRSAGGRIWFTLRDRTAQISVTVPATRAGRFTISNGDRVCVTGTLTWVSDRGQVNFTAEHVAPVGEGAIAAAIAEARARLDADGLLARPRRLLPRLPRRVAVVCGTEAAVRKDIESVVAARFPGYPVEFVEVGVSGPAAADTVARAVRALDARDDVDVIILARGGGDAAQLLPFSDEELCRAVAASGTPVVSAIGHDGDRPLCDDVADLRCGTPSIAAAAVIPSRAELDAELDRLLAAGGRTLADRLAVAQRRLAAADHHRGARDATAAARHRLQTAAGRLALVHPSRLAADARARLRRIDPHTAMGRRVAAAAEALAARRRELDALDPTRVLQRGYAVVRAADGRVVRHPGDVAAGDSLRIAVAGGEFGARVEPPESTSPPTDTETVDQ